MAQRLRPAFLHAGIAVVLSTLLAACSGSSDPDTGSASPDATGTPGVFRTIATWAGSPDPGGPGDRDGVGSDARLVLPNSVTVAADGSVWIAEQWPSRLRRLTPDGRVTTVFQGAAEVQWDGHRRFLLRPGAITAGPSGEVFVSMRTSTLQPGDGPSVVMRFAPGVAPEVVVSPADEYTFSFPPRALALDGQGRLLIASACGLWRSGGAVLGTTVPRGVVRLHDSYRGVDHNGCGGLDRLDWITRLALDAEDRPLFTLGSGELLRLEPDMRVTMLGQTSAGPAPDCGGMAADRRGPLLLTGGGTVLIQRDASGREQVLAGSPAEGGWFDGGAERARFRSLCGLAIDGQGRVFVADTDNHAVRRIDPDGRVSTVVGLAPQVGHRDGTGTQALFGAFFSVGPGLDGGVVVADLSNTVVRGVDAQQHVTTLAGVPGHPAGDPGADGPVATARLLQPSTALMTADGNLWIGDNTVLRRLVPDGTVRTVAAARPALQRVLTMALDRAGDVVVGWGTTTWAGPDAYPTVHHFERYSSADPQAAPVRLGLAVADDLSQRLQGLPMQGTCTLADGTLAYTQYHAVLRRAADGTVSLLAGSPDETGAQDGAATAARFQWPAGLACDAAGGVYVADRANHTVRYIDAQRRVRTVLGTAGRAGHRVDALPGELHGPGSLALVPGGLIVGTGLGLVRAGF